MLNLQKWSSPVFLVMEPKPKPKPEESLDVVVENVVDEVAANLLSKGLGAPNVLGQ